VGFRDGCQTPGDRRRRQTGDHTGRDVERDGFRSGWQGSQAVIGAPGIIDPEI
jgi:hypothetical protein